MKAKKQRRAGATVTFSVSIDPETKRALRVLADEDFGGNLSAAITDLAGEARRRLAARAVVRRAGLRPFTREEADAFEAEIERDVSAGRTPRRKRHTAA
jgi:hypothetical protein